MTQEWKSGDRAMVEIADAGNSKFKGCVRLKGSAMWINEEAIGPLPPALTPEDAAVLEAADLFAWVAGKPTNHHADDYRTLYQAIQARISARAARQSPPVPADSAGQPESAAQPEATPPKVTELLYPLPDGSAVLLSDVRKINVSEIDGKMLVTLGFGDGTYKSIPFEVAGNAYAYADTIRDLVNAARSGQPYTRDTSAATEVAPAAPAFKVGDRVRRQDVSEGVVEIGSNGNDICYVKWDQGSWSWCQINCLSSIFRAAEAPPPPPRDPVEELREAAKDAKKWLELVAEGCFVRPDSMCSTLDRLRAALAAMKDAQ